MSTWIDDAWMGVTIDHAELWVRSIREAISADVCLLYVEDGEILKGALVELGAAIAAGRRAIWVGPTSIEEPGRGRRIHTVTNHPAVTPVRDLEAALERLADWGQIGSAR